MGFMSEGSVTRMLSISASALRNRLIGVIPKLGFDNLDRHIALQLLVVRAINLAHTTAADLLNYPVVRDSLANHWEVAL